MGVGKIKVFKATSVRRGQVLLDMGLAAQRLGLDCEVIEDLAYSECDVAVVWGMPKERSGRSIASIERRRFRQDVFARHSGRVVVMEAPVLGRRVKAPANLPLLIRKLLPKFQTRKTLDPFAHYRVGLGGFPDEGGWRLRPSAPVAGRICLVPSAFRSPVPTVPTVGIFL